MPQSRPTAVWEAIWRSFTENLLFNEKRGLEASGAAVLQMDGRLRIVKQAVPAHEFVQTAAYQSLRDELGPQTALLLGHTRQPTQGSPQLPGNNHPIQVGAVFGVHNGRIRNDNQLFAQANYNRLAQVDSEIIFQLLQPHPPLPANPCYLHTIQPLLQQLDGDFTFLAGDSRAPGRLLLVKHRQPMSAYYQVNWQALLFSSRYIFLRKQFGRAVQSTVLVPDQLVLYDAARLHERQHLPVATLPLYNAVEEGCSG